MKRKLTKKELSWILYDCGNSAYSITITTALFPAYLGMISAGQGMKLGLVNSIASAIVAVLSPIIGTIADYKDIKKRFFAFFGMLGILCTALLGVIPKNMWQMVLVIYVFTAVGFAGANVFYDAFIVDVTDDDRMDRVSTIGFAYGYIASIIPFGIALFIVNLLGTENTLGYQIGFGITALWWGLFTIPLLKYVKQIHYVEPEPNPIAKSFRRLGKTFKEIRNYRVVVTFIVAYFLYIDGVGTIIKMSVPYATETLGLDSKNTFLLLGILLVIQIIAFPFAVLYGILAKKYGTLNMIIVAIGTYIFATVFAFFMVELWHVFILGGLIGSAQGGIQALSRSYYAKIIPKKNANEFFGFYNVFGKFAAILGPLFMWLVDEFTGNTKMSILVLIPFFVIGLLIILRLPKSVQDSE